MFPVFLSFCLTLSCILLYTKHSQIHSQMHHIHVNTTAKSGIYKMLLCIKYKLSHCTNHVGIEYMKIGRIENNGSNISLKTIELEWQLYSNQSLMRMHANYNEVYEHAVTMANSPTDWLNHPVHYLQHPRQKLTPHSLNLQWACH